MSQRAVVEVGRVTRLHDGQLVNVSFVVIVLMRGERPGSMIYREFKGEDVIGRMVARGAREDVMPHSLEPLD
jgi:hypothetical protein